MDGTPTHTTASTELGRSGFQDGTRPVTDKLERCGQEGSVKNKDGIHLGKGGNSSPQQARMV